ncbi:MAG: hypothetical protein ACRDMH_12240 [Solirubrobacterales bacterium]
MTCTLSSGGRMMDLSIGGWGQSDLFSIATRPATIQATQFIRSREEIPCIGGVPTVHTVDRIDVHQAQPPGEYSSSGFLLNLARGPLAPGATPEASGRPEIEVSLHLPSGRLALLTPPGSNQVSFGLRHGDVALNLNGDDDLDMVLGRAFFIDISAGKGSDTVDARVRPDGARPRHPRAFIWGESGSDTLIAGHAGDQLYGGQGPDFVVGSKGGKGNFLGGGAGADIIVARRTRNLIIAGGGDDHVDARNGVRDWISCGSGRDHARVDRHEEHLSGCERVHRG